MYGFPLTIYLLTWLVGYQNPLTHNAGHLLYPFVSMEGYGLIGHGLSDVMILGGILLVLSGGKSIYSGVDAFVTIGMYKRLRHPQYLGILLATAGLLLQWPTLPAIVMWPILVILYYRLAKREEREMVVKFGEAYIEYRRRTPMFIPRVGVRGLARQILSKRENPY